MLEPAAAWLSQLRFRDQKFPEPNLAPDKMKKLKPSLVISLVIKGYNKVLQGRYGT